MTSPAGQPAALSAAIPAAIDDEAVTRALHQLYIPVESTRLRKEEAQKVREMSALLGEIAAVLRRLSATRELVLVDAAAGRGYVAFLTTSLLLLPSGRRFRWVILEREEGRARACRSVAAQHLPQAAIEVRRADVGEAAAWPDSPDLVVALHACGPAADAILDRSCEARARALLLAPCCVSKAVLAHGRAEAVAEALAIPRQAQVRRRFLESMIAAERTLRLEARGYQTEVIELCSPTVTPHNLLWRARRVREPLRMQRAAASLAQLQGKAP